MIEVVGPTFEAFFEANHRRVRASMVAAVGEVDLALDAADEAFARAYLHWERVGAMAEPRAWVFKVALSTARRRARRRAMEATLLRRVPIAMELPPAAGEVWLLVRDLPERQREAVVLRYLGDLTEAQVAEAMGIRRGTVSSTLRDATARLGQALTAEPEMEGER